METNNEAIDPLAFGIGNQVQLTNQEELSLDVDIPLELYSDEVEDILTVGSIKVKIFDEKWADYLYASDADGTHLHIFSEVVKQTNTESSVFKGLYLVNPKQQGLEVSGRVAIVDMNHYSLKIKREYWDEEIIWLIFEQVEEYLASILNVDFIVLDLNHESLESAKVRPGLYLLGGIEELEEAKSMQDIQHLLMDVQSTLEGCNYVKSGRDDNTLYMVKEL